MADYFVDIVNEKDIVVGRQLKSVAHAKRLLHRVIHVFVFNRNGEIFLQTRAKKPFDNAEGLLDASVGGHVDAGSDYAQTAEKEFLEELGVSSPLTFETTFAQLTDADLIHFCACFSAKHDGPFTLDPKEATTGRFYSISELKKLVQQSNPVFTPETKMSLQFLLKKYS